MDGRKRELYELLRGLRVRAEAARRAARKPYAQATALQPAVHSRLGSKAFEGKRASAWASRRFENFSVPQAGSDPQVEAMAAVWADWADEPLDTVALLKLLEDARDELAAQRGSGAASATSSPTTPSPATTSAAPALRFGRVPPRVPAFQSRAHVGELRDALGRGGGVVLSDADDRVTLAGVLAGGGGVGKTQLAADYAESADADGELDVLVWVTATEREAVVARYAEAGRALCGADPENADRAAEQFLVWLGATPGRPGARWLVVLDDVADPRAMRGLWPPEPARGRTLATTRRRDAAILRGRRLVAVGVFSSEESRSYLAELVAGRETRAVELDALADDLGHLPLALSQAAAYITDAGIDVPAYRERFARARALTDVLPVGGSLPDDQLLTVTATVALSLDRADALRPYGLARPMLRLVALLDPHGIPESVLTNEVVTTYLDDDAGGTTAQDALRALHQLHLVDHDTGRGVVRAHALTQQAVRDTTPASIADRLPSVGADALLMAWPDNDYSNRDSADAFRRNVDSLITRGAEHLWLPRPHLALSRACTSLDDAGLFAAALARWRDLAERVAERLGETHPDTLGIRGNLGNALHQAGRTAEAIRFQETNLSACSSVLGSEHPHTLATRANLAGYYQEVGRLDEAIAQLVQVLADGEHVLDAHGAERLSILGHLAAVYQRAGDSAEAVALHKQVLADHENILGVDHPDTFVARSNLASAYARAGRTRDALRLSEQVVADRTRVLGAEHASTLASRAGLAVSYFEVNRRREAILMLRQVLAVQERILDVDHPDTLRTRNHLGVAYIGERRTAEAVPILREAYLGRARVLGPDHPDTLTSRVNVAIARALIGGRGRARPELERILQHSLRVLGAEHEVTRSIQTLLSP